MAVFDLDVRLYRLGKKNVDVINALNSAGFTYRDSIFRTDPTAYGKAKNGLDKSPKALFTMTKANEIVSAWEKSKNHRRI